MFRKKSALILVFASATCLANESVAGSGCLLVENQQSLSESASTLTISKINFVRHDIFDLTHPNTLWFHRFANEYHVITTEPTIRDDVLFLEGENLNLAVLAETERLLRSRSYLRQAEVQVTEYCQDSQSVVVTVSTWDNWSLLPKISLGHEGGETKSNIGFAEDNLFGTGNQLQAEYFNDSERDGYQLKFVSPNIGGSHWQTALQYADNSDGESYTVRLSKPFYRISSDWAFNAEISKEIKDVSEYELGEVYNEYRSNRDYLEVSGGWKISQNDNQVQHLNVGVTLDDHQFSINEYSTIQQPMDRDLSQIWVGWDWFESDFQKMFNFFQFNKVEDINFGWQAGVRLGALNKSLGADTSGWNLQAHVAKNWQLSPVSWLTYRSEYQQLESEAFASQHLFSNHLRYIHHLTDNQVWISQFQWNVGKNLFRDQRINIGGDDGMRAFPLYYQSGNKSAIASTEYRYITSWHLYQLVDVALAAFVDAGRAWDNPERMTTIDTKALYGYGIGIRLLPSHASRGSIISIDLSKPVTDNPELSGWRWRLIAKREF
ncbi:MAG: BamA/TamA family outer membrane protein [Gammaproteobacteria bacterium]|jgi:outer membrane protein assembly factor BamA|nr:BamA/TamA family outer membrane protein [Gammaproteobacteria bacterium]MBU2179860.1 BamA/TamA family outer membrane protein [Gammaproteobacteria bacterium]MBU2224306.1 BamA/TamA family outer membrane protein [Gammaproteobacteria bacterium]MBU2279307.1 BamA/TamA family outer membrane protein [Gammaproteobacteria bacterium]MBU2428138.1 BamA/TamA family outer membrane protein [Gammaproteobacteria bacterium]